MTTQTSTRTLSKKASNTSGCTFNANAFLTLDEAYMRSLPGYDELMQEKAETSKPRTTNIIKKAPKKAGNSSTTIKQKQKAHRRQLTMMYNHQKIVAAQRRRMAEIAYRARLEDERFFAGMYSHGGVSSFYGRNETEHMWQYSKGYIAD